MKTITHNSSAENWLLLNLLRPYLRNQFVDRGKWFLMERLNPKPGDDLGWGKIGILASKVYDGTFIRCDMQHAADRFMYFTGEYEIGTTRFLSRVAGKNWRMVDVGANVGKYMVLAAPLVKEVHCFEPNPISRDLLEANVKLNEFDNVRVHSLALSDQDGRTVLFQSGENIGGASLLENQESTQQHNISMVKGDSVIAADGHPVYLKIDVEGFEEHVLRGFNNLLSERNVVVQVEVTSEWLRKAGGSAESLFSFMAGLGYFAYKVKTKSGIRTQPDLIRLANPVNDFQYDVYFLPFDNLNDFFAWVSDHGNRTFKWPERLTKSS